MTEDVKPITVEILDKEYVVGCAEDEREALFATIEFLNNKMNEQRDSGKVIGNERVAVMAALNIAHEYLEYKRQKESFANDFGDRFDRIQEKIGATLEKCQQFAATEFNDISTEAN